MNLPTKVTITKKYLFQNIKWSNSTKRWFTDVSVVPTFLGDLTELTKECIVKDEIIREVFMGYDGSERKSEIISDLVGIFTIIKFNEDGNSGNMEFEKSK